ncbi:sodium-coupled monocarboxylate transporter 2-like [Polistes fuscatus]|uniref:sodium-coupled monocarboxylate transporter 2-like n=1 Tax=Polistes fuscatus TaxID=30207 RepID=UPI001CA93C5C|nr:sodium-coupled monocarboxylate transporter 2-like [Polistes fuscatus]XP_043502868.1 sodium-coupled monocarboxylate transporter 2-like [Polistes fuscatus]XP_043502879.1 sodium-coupled monocarboxylate transporter 2-like [Polistes fuscatus]XP_043502884.1 sodium-coupled monocarboxylate transporter 2-like [Polistes fuscatus]XP_043502892.1 sodium-coupled monocarboxylate transporter 2-like [Polistes fuscatus]XP_043502901.1 sodium-coupled monocarboxylate transporter 2-like [Polistes fuscatus]
MFENSSENGHFHWVDWLVFAAMLTISAAAGLWHYKSAQKSTVENYLLGGRKLSLWPVSASLIASFISGVTIVGAPAEIYNFGTQYWITVISLFFSGVVIASVYLPVFVTLKLNSAYEYLEIRFNKGVRILISLIFVLDAVLYQSIVVYVPALALNQVSDINTYIVSAIICGVCVFYTVLGGLKAVVWTDMLQVIIMILAVFIVTIIGTYEVGGPSEVWQKAREANRIEFFNFDSSLYTRHTVWSVLIGSWLFSTGYIAVNQTMVQRYTSLKTVKASKLAIGISITGIIIFISLCCWCGLVLLAWWSPPKCDPRAIGLIKADDQLLPAFVMQAAGHLHGIPGLFIAGIFGAALSSLSVGFNSTSVVLLEDFVKSCFGLEPNERCSTILVKSIVIVLGLIALAFIFFIETLGGILVVTNSLSAIAAGISFGVFTLGMLFPWTNSQGAFVGAVVGFLIAGWACLGANISISFGDIVPKKLPVPLTQCPGNISQSFLDQFVHHDEEDIFALYRLSYHWFSGLGTVIVIVIGGIVSWFTGPRDPSYVDRKLLSPVIHRWLPYPRYQNEEWYRDTIEPQASVNLLLKNIPKKLKHNNTSEKKENHYDAAVS